MEQQTHTATATKRKAKPKAKAKPSRAISTVVHQPPTPAVPPSNMLQVIATAVMDPRCDVEKMKALLDMQERIEQRDAQKAFTVAFNKLQAELPVINRDGRIDHSADGGTTTRSGKRALKTSYATYPALNRVCGPLLKKHGFTFSTSMEPEPSGVMVAVSTLEHVEGASRKTQFRLTADATGGKNNQQGWGSSQQYGMRYNMIALLNIVTETKEDADNDGFPQSELITDAQTKELIRLLDEAGGDKAKFCAAFEVDGIAMLPASSFEDAKQRIATYKATKAKLTHDFPGDRR